jgi:hypothetical protein
MRRPCDSSSSWEVNDLNNRILSLIVRNKWTLAVATLGAAVAVAGAGAKWA